MPKGIYIHKKRSDETKLKLRLLQLGKKRCPMSEEQKIKISNALKGRKHTPEHILKAGLARRGKRPWVIPWNKGMNKEELLVRYKNGFRGGREKGYKHTEEAKKNMSLNATGVKHNIIFTDERKKFFSEQMRKNREDVSFNQKMMDSNKRSITKPHLIVLSYIKKYTTLKTQSNYCYKFGSRVGSIDEVEPDLKIAIYVDGNYWHKYPDGRRWDRYCAKYLENRGWLVLRFWESEIYDEHEKIIQKLIEAEQQRMIIV